MALKIAHLSAHIVIPKEEFSILQPVYIFPLLARTQAPTANLENGEYDFSDAFFASSMSNL